MKILADWLQKQEVGWDNAPVYRYQPDSGLRPDQHVGDFIEQVMKSLQCICAANPGRKGRLKMRTPFTSEPLKVCVLLARNTPHAAPAMWHELCIHDRSTMSATNEGHRQALNLPCICKALRYSSIDFDHRLDLVLDRTHLQKGSDYFMDPHNISLRPEALQTEVDLKSLLSVTHLPLPIRTKIALGLILSRSLLDSWTHEGVRRRLRRDNIYLFYEGDHFPLQTFMGTALLERLDINHPYPEIAELGIALLEIALGRMPSPSELGFSDTGSWTEISRAQKVLDRMEYQLTVFRKAIKTCLMPSAWSEATDNSMIQELLLADVILPLKKDLDAVKDDFYVAHFESRKQNLGKLAPEEMHDAPIISTQTVLTVDSQIQSHDRDNPGDDEFTDRPDAFRDNGVYFDAVTKDIRQVSLP